MIKVIKHLKNWRFNKRNDVIENLKYWLTKYDHVIKEKDSVIWIKINNIIINYNENAIYLKIIK